MTWVAKYTLEMVVNRLLEPAPQGMGAAQRFGQENRLVILELVERNVLRFVRVQLFIDTTLESRFEQKQ